MDPISYLGLKLVKLCHKLSEIYCHSGDNLHELLSWNILFWLLLVLDIRKLLNFGQVMTFVLAWLTFDRLLITFMRFRLLLIITVELLIFTQPIFVLYKVFLGLIKLVRRVLAFLNAFREYITFFFLIFYVNLLIFLFWTHNFRSHWFLFHLI